MKYFETVYSLDDEVGVVILLCIGVGELMFQTGVVQGASFQPFFPLLITSLIYFVLTFSISRALGYAEKRMARSSR